MDLSDWRRKIDGIDADILDLLEQRAEIVSKIGEFKTEHNLPVCDKGREQQIFSRISVKPGSILSLESAICIFQCIVRESRRIQTQTKRKNVGQTSNTR